ncbi:hypothetical protein F4775DRAFT_590680 [Biscogniauxia sp. FL1348]|nr:hypothetical protein F4775DRAFT_590680 [Biscogniauxia sp. FL1348]
MPSLSFPESRITPPPLPHPHSLPPFLIPASIIGSLLLIAIFIFISICPYRQSPAPTANTSNGHTQLESEYEFDSDSDSDTDSEFEAVAGKTLFPGVPGGDEERWQSNKQPGWRRSIDAVVCSPYVADEVAEMPWCDAWERRYVDFLAIELDYERQLS